ncbi:MAG: maltokinase N-terminal cap-like domain-containing protein, partial [Gemmatimonadaceae bacterium]
MKEERRTTLPGAPTIEVRGGLQAALTAESLAAIPIRHLENWLGARRWFGAKGRKIASALFRFVAPFPLSVGAGAMSVLEVSFEGSCELAWYQLPLIVLPTRIGDSSVSPRVLAHVVSSGECGIVMDATEDARFRGGVGELLGNGSVLDATDGSWVFEPVGSSARVVPATSRLGQTEQSNTSIVYGESEILKLFRKLEVGEHPDVEIARFLTTRTTFRNTPELLGSIRLESAVGASVSGMLARYATRATDAWAHALFRAREYLTAEDDSPANPFAGEARELGRVTRQLHEALSSAADDPAFAPVRVGDAHIAAWADAARGATEQGFDLLARRVDTLDAPMRAPAQALLRRRGAASAHVDALA